MRLFPLLLFACFGYCYNATAQNDVRAHVVYAEALTVGGLAVGTINYDVRFEDRTHGLGIRVGAGLLGAGGETLAFPLALNAVFGEGGHCFEGALGVYLFSRTGVGTGTAFVPSASYRYQPAYSGLMFRASASPFISSGGVLFGGGISIGYRF